MQKKNCIYQNHSHLIHLKQELAYNLDFVRYTTLELCCNEIKRNKVNGNVAELGVYKGDFAKRLNQLFPDKKLYLFDTFEGFDEKDITYRKAKIFFKR